MLVVASITYEELQADEVLFFLIKFLGFKDPSHFSSASAGRSFALFFSVDRYLFCYGCFDRMWATEGDVGLAAFDFRLEAGAFLLLGNNPSFLLFAECEFFFAPGLVMEAIILLSLPVTVSPNMGIELGWSFFNLDGDCGCGFLIFVLIQKDGASASERQDVSREDVGEFAVHSWLLQR